MESPFQILQVDIMEPLISLKWKYKYIIVFQGLFTKWPIAYTAPDQEPNTLHNWLLRKLYIDLVYLRLLSDRGTNL